MVKEQLIPIQMGGGVNTKPDPKQLPAGQLLTLQNGIFTKQGQISKRSGYDILNTTIEGGGSMTAGTELANYKNELIAFDGNYMYSYLTTTGNWSNRGTAISVITEDKDIIRSSSNQQINPDMAFLNGMEVYAWEDSRGGIRYSVLDSATKAFAIADASLAAGYQPKVVAFQNQIFILYTDLNSQIFYQTVNPYNPTVVTSATTIVTDGYNSVLGGFGYDASVIGDKLVVAYQGGSPNTGAIRFFYLDAAFNKSGATNVETRVGFAAVDGYRGSLNVVGDISNNIWISWSTGGANSDTQKILTSAFSYNSNLLLASTMIDQTVRSNLLAGIESVTANTLLLFYQGENPLPYNTVVRYAIITLTGSVTINNTIRSQGIGSKPWKYNNNIYLNTTYQSTLQSTYFTYVIAQTTLNTNPVVIAKHCPSTGGGLSTNNMCPNTAIISAGIFKFANLTSGKIFSEANTVSSLLGVNSTRITFTPSNNFVNTVQSNTLLFVGGILQGYDGVSATELGFNLYPENISASPSNTDGFLSTGTYQYIVEYQWTDNWGQIHRSSPSVPISVNVTATNHVFLQGPTLRITQKNKVNVVIYRTQANATLFRRVTSITAPLINDPTVDSWSFTDILSDQDISANELDYTTGGVLANIAPPSNSIITTYNDRVFLSGLSDKLSMWYSQTTVDNSANNTIPPQFSDELTIAVDPKGGDITALGLLNQALIIFKYSHIFSLQGNGPNPTGANNDYADATLITSDVGCVNPNSVQIMPDGLMFQSAKGIYLLDQNVNLHYIGAPVEDFNNYTITSAVLDGTANQVIFTTSQGTALVYDYLFEQWSTWTNHYAQDAVIWNNKLAYIRSNGQVYLQNPNKYMDGSSPIYLSWTLPNLSFAGLQGFQRVYRVYLLGTFKSKHTLDVAVAYDFNTNYTQYSTINASANVSTWGSDPTWGQSATWGGQYQIYEFRVDFNIQKCTSIRIRVSDNQTSSYGEGYAISSVVFGVGALPGGNRLPTTNTYGAK